MSKFTLAQTAAEVQGILNNSLQKPTGLTKTKLVGVGVNGQENIEIGDNLTLANGKLSSTTTGGGSTGPARHVYDVIINGTCQYTAYTTKDLNLPIGEQTQIDDFATNDEYKELRKIGKHFANGYFELASAKKG